MNKTHVFSQAANIIESAFALETPLFIPWHFNRSVSHLKDNITKYLWRVQNKINDFIWRLNSIPRTTKLINIILSVVLF